MPQWVNLARWLHILASAAWFGEIAMMAFVLVPHASRLTRSGRSEFISQVFPRVSLFASWFIVMSMASGLWLNFLLTGWVSLGEYLLSPRGLFILVGGVSGLIVAGIHFLVADQIERRAAQTLAEPRLEEQLLTFLQVIPKVGFVLISVAFVTMMIAARGY